jgi:hypothetical protein
VGSSGITFGANQPGEKGHRMSWLLANVDVFKITLIVLANEIAKVSAPAFDTLRAELYVSFSLLLIGLALWVVCLRLVAPPREARLILPGRSFTMLSHWLASLIGLIVSVSVVLLFMEA